MKIRMLSMLMFAALAATAGTPQPAQVVYGRVRDAFGFPYVETGRIRFTRAGVECARQDFQSLLADGLNYRVTLDQDSGGTPYAPHAVQPGQTLDIAVEVGGVPQPLIPTHRLTVGAPGSSVRLDLCTGTDADGDGLPDEWEALLCEQSEGRLAGIEAVRPEDDFDGDGLSNREEFLAGTFAFLRTDLLAVETVERVAANRVKLRFLTSQNVSYRLVAVDGLPATAWAPLRFAVDPAEPVAYRDLVGDGTFRTLYIETTATALYLRLAAQ